MAAFGHGLVWIYDRDGTGYRRTLSGAKGLEARAMELFVKRLRRERKWPMLDHIIAGRCTIADLFYAERDGTLPELLRRLDAGAVPMLDSLVDEWAAVARSAKYVRQVRAFLAWMESAKHRASLDAFTRKRASEFLASLTVQGPTKNRYRVALMQFAKWLVERELLETNPIRDVRGYAENEPRMVHYSREQAVALVKAIGDARQRALEALMAGTGCEWGAAERVRGRDVRYETREVYADGPKNAKGRGQKWRKRWVRFTEEWAWDVFRAYARPFSANARLFEGLSERAALAAHHEAVTAQGLESSTLHDWRHTYAILSLDDGIKPATVRRQLGHAPNSTILERVYAAHLPTSDADYEKRNVPKKVTTTGTTARRSVK